MAKTRKLRRAERDLRIAEAREKALRDNAKQMRRRELWRKLTLHEMRQRRRGRVFTRRDSSQTALVGVTTVLALVIIWTVVPSLALRIVLSLLLVLALPVLVVVAFDRKGS